MRKEVNIGFCAMLLSLFIASCTNVAPDRRSKGAADSVASASADTASKLAGDKSDLLTEAGKIELAEPEVLKLVGDSQINRASKFYAGLSCEGIKLTDEEKEAWTKYSKSIGQMKKKSFATLSKADSLVVADMSDVRERCNYVFYPFSGPDFLYPITLFPNADFYFMAGLEAPGNIDTKINAESRYFNKYTSSLKIYMRSSFFRTLSMKNDFRSEEIDGIAPVISMLMALEDCQVISIRDVDIDENGAIVDAAADKKRRMVEIKFFQEKTPQHLQTLYYFSGNMHDGGFPKNLKEYAAATLPNYQVVTYLKAASYLMHETYFSKIRNIVLDYSFAVLEDDSGIPYRFFKDNWDVSLYGKYLHPISIFNAVAYQKDLEEVYATSKDIKKLPIRIGYNNPSNWMIARKKADKPSIENSCKE